MTPEQTKQKKLVIYALIVLGFAGLIAAHEFTGAGENADLALPFILAAIGTLCFIGAGLLARRLMKQIASK
jgi:amino acid transporter